METQRDKMLAGELYDPQDAELVQAQLYARRLLAQFNQSAPDARAQRADILQALFAGVGMDAWIEPPFFCDYGSNITLGKQVFLNFNCVILDPAAVRIGDCVLFGPGVQLYTATHPLKHEARCRGLESACPINIGSNVWLGGGAIVLPGVSVGARAVIGAGSVVTADIPEDVLAVGNPCRVVRSLV